MLVGDIRRRPVKNHTPEAHGHDPTAMSECEWSIVHTGDKSPMAIGGLFGQNGHDRLGAGRIESAHRFVCQQKVRPLEEGPSDRRSLLLTAGQSVGPLPNFVLDTDGVERSTDLVYRTRPDEGSNGTGKRPLPESPGGNVCCGSQRSDQGIVLTDDPDPASNRSMSTVSYDIARNSEDLYIASRREGQPGSQRQNGALTGP